MRPNNWCYVNWDAASGEVKIGQSKAPERRLMFLRVKRPYTVILFTFPDHSVERELHSRWAERGVGGEWFRPDKEMQEWISQHFGERPDLVGATALRPGWKLLYIPLLLALLHFAAGFALVGEVIALEEPVINASTISGLVAIFVAGVAFMVAFHRGLMNATNGHRQVELQP